MHAYIHTYSNRGLGSHHNGMFYTLFTLHTYICMFMYAYIHTCMHAHIHKCSNMYVCMHACMFLTDFVSKDAKDANIKSQESVLRSCMMRPECKHQGKHKGIMVFRVAHAQHAHTRCTQIRTRAHREVTHTESHRRIHASTKTYTHSHTMIDRASRPSIVGNATTD
jgi:hypothetical protein